MAGVDLIGPFKASSKGNRYCLTATDLFTKWVEAIPIKEKTAVATSQALMDMFYTHGAPEVENFGVKHRIMSAYHPQTNGLDERTNQTLKRAIGKTLDGHQERLREIFLRWKLPILMRMMWRSTFRQGLRKTERLLTRCVDK
ncbi:hypothetical protein SKAU_G00025880 [Synaphobranchus kaupii]|uniref:Integrase catalytic domain-containing protein n=1 Tax=Synaphobranchus kaupii TaxID=118154 RepID=A0A9Q1JEE9_SYNKA|nr:hypothetical protein SKAU_G00025880 [Synaphobranchus kaupii]